MKQEVSWTNLGVELPDLEGALPLHQTNQKRPHQPKEEEGAEGLRVQQPLFIIKNLLACPLFLFFSNSYSFPW